MIRHLEVQGSRSPDDVWERYARPGRWPEWAPQIRSVTYPGVVIAPGTGGVVHGPGGLRVRFRILDVDPAGPVRSWSWAVSVAGVRLWLRHTVAPVDGGGTRTGLTVRGGAPVVLGYLPVARWALGHLVRA